MLIIPWNTDAPIYHGPWATLGLIAANTAAFAAAWTSDGSAVEPWMLHFGQGLRPVEWVSSIFMHADIMHLVGNMIFLWAFGLIVEGKIGWLRFLAVYLGIGATECGVEQALMLGAHGGGSLGASGVIFGLLAITVIWAPKNDLSCVWFLGVRPRTFDTPILTFGLLYIGMEILFAWFDGFALSSAMLHLGGAALGLVVGVGMLKADWVDCEHWDLFAVIAGRVGEAPARKPAEVAPQPEDPKAAAVALESVRQALAQGKGRLALALHEKLAHTRPGWQLSERDLLSLVDTLHKEQAWAESVPLLVEYVRCYPARSHRPRLKLAHLLIRLGRPAQALRVLAKLPAGALPLDVEKVCRQLVAQADKLRDEGALELEAEDW